MYYLCNKRFVVGLCLAWLIASSHSEARKLWKKDRSMCPCSWVILIFSFLLGIKMSLLVLVSELCWPYFLKWTEKGSFSFTIWNRVFEMGIIFSCKYLVRITYKASWIWIFFVGMFLTTNSLSKNRYKAIQIFCFFLCQLIGLFL